LLFKPLKNFLKLKLPEIVNYSSSNNVNYGFFMKIVAIKQQNNEYVPKKRQKACEGLLI
jgi:hypothetical protein